MLIEVAFACPELQLLIEVEVVENSRVKDVLIKTDILSKISPYIKTNNLNELNLGIFGRKCELTTKVQNKDRIEIYRDLYMNPKDARRVRAKKD